ncbi:molybdopterin dinucleotide binding domain-containing protein [Streptomyces brevispora]|uniref:molybdopterin dinucleotide binding domain-containing protein n=1 Tax=Streptomyces brevispora TaxID=887462 RepID=UPI0035DA559C
MSHDPSSTRTALRICPLCEATCGLTLTIEGTRVTGARGDRDDVFSQGFICPKGASIGGLDEDPDRLRTPLVRKGGVLTETSWNDAFDAIARALPAVAEEHGAQAVGVVLGNPNVHTMAGALYPSALLAALRTRSLFTASTLDQMPKHVSSGLLFGDPNAIRRSGRIELLPAPIAADLPRLRGALAARTDPEALVLIGRRHLRSNNSWMHNVAALTGGSNVCTLQMHPQDAARLQLADGAAATVTADGGELTAPVEITDCVRTGVVSLPHGWGHSRPGTRMSVAAAQPGVNVNQLLDGTRLDPLSGTAVLNGIPVTVAPAH